MNGLISDYIIQQLLPNYQLHIIFNQLTKMQEPIITSNNSHIQCLVRFQCQMAMETQHLKLNPELIAKAIKFLHQNPEYGFYLVSPNTKQSFSQKLPIISVLMITKEHHKSWWIQSVYVQQQFRRKGNFTRLFQKAVQTAKQQGVKMIRLYAQKQNQRAKQTYKKLGMDLTGETFYSFDMVLTKHKPDLNIKQIFDFNFKLISHKENGQTSWKEFKDRNIPSETFISYVDNTPSIQNCGILISGKQGRILGYCQHFSEFSDWRNSLIIYINQLHISKNCQITAQELTKVLMNHLLKPRGELSIGVLRFLIRQEQLQRVKQIVKGGQVEAYDVMGIAI